MKQATTKITNAVVIGSPVYTPSYINDKDKVVAQRCDFSILYDGKCLRVAAWADKADMCAKSCSPGTKVDLELIPCHYIGIVHNLDGTVLKDKSGKDFRVEKNAFIVDDIVVRNKSEETIKCTLHQIEKL